MKIFFKIQALLIYELCNKNHLKNINDQNFSHFMRGYDKGFYGITPIFAKENLTWENIEGINITIHGIQQKIEELDSNSADFFSQLKRADLLYLRVDEIERKMTKQYEEIKYDISAIKENYNLLVQK